MKYLIVSDIHGSLSSMKFIKNLDETYDFKNIFILGDINYNGARNVPPSDYSPLDVTKTINSMNKDKIVFIRGNCDSRVDEFVLDKEFHDILKLKIKNHRFILTHGDIYDKCNLKLKKNDVLLYGHTHIYELHKNSNNTYFINPGSITLPKNNNPRTYLIFDDENNEFSLYNYSNELINTLTI